MSSGQKDEIGHLVHRRGGTWAFDYDTKSTDDDEPGFKFDRHHFVPGEYVSITEHDGVMRTFRVIWLGIWTKVRGGASVVGRMASCTM
jgi:hypothetical protein